MKLVLWPLCGVVAHLAGHGLVIERSPVQSPVDWSAHGVINTAVTLICRIISNMKRGKAPGIDGLSVEHLSYSHPALPVVMSKLFKLIFNCGYVPSGFKKSYVVPIPKIRDCRTKAMMYDDFRG